MIAVYSENHTKPTKKYTWWKNVILLNAEVDGAQLSSQWFKGLNVKQAQNLYRQQDSNTE
jgi:hypothetical protein